MPRPTGAPGARGDQRGDARQARLRVTHGRRRIAVDAAGLLIAADHQNGRDVEPCCRHQVAGRGLVAAGQADHPIEQRGFHLAKDGTWAALLRDSVGEPVELYQADLASGKLVWDERMRQLYGVGSGEFEGTYAAWSNHHKPQNAHK